MKKFGEWLSEQLEEQGLKPADLTRMSNGRLDSGVLSNLINNKRQQPSVETCKLISKYMNIPLEQVYRASGILPAETDKDTITEAVINLMSDLQMDDKKDVLEYVKLRRKLATARTRTTG